jgi:hypothetical protein
VETLDKNLMDSLGTCLEWEGGREGGREGRVYSE